MVGKVSATPTDARTGGNPGPVAPPHGSRARRPRRWWGWAAAVVVLGVGIAAAVVDVGPSPPGRPPGTGAQPATSALRAVEVRAFTGSFAPQELFSVDGALWLEGTTGSNRLPAQCALEELDPVNLQSRVFSLPACPQDAAVGAGHIYFAMSSHAAGADTDTFHIESFDTDTGAASVFAPVITVTNGSGYAHTTLAYGDGSLWFESWGSDILQISPSTGAVVGRVAGIPVSDSGQMSVVVTASGTWADGGGATLVRMAPGARRPSTVYTGAGDSLMVWVSAVGGRVWAGVLHVADGGRGRQMMYLLGFSGSGRRVAQRLNSPIGEMPVVGSGSRLWAIGNGGFSHSCMGPERIWSLDAGTGAPVASTVLPSAGNSCVGGLSQLATIGSAVYVLQPAGQRGGGLLYRVTSPLR